jgi:hypothetical protein
MKKYLLLVGFLAMYPALAHAVEPKPKHIFVKTDCQDTLGMEVATALREAIRASAGYQLAENLTDDGGYGLVITMNVECTESKMPNGELVVAIASVVGHGSCTGPRNCSISPFVETLEASLCSGSTGARCGRDLYNSMDLYMSNAGNYIFKTMSERLKAAQPQN